MPLPDFSKLKTYLLESKHDDQTWGDFFRSRANISSSSDNYLEETGLLPILTIWDIFSTSKLDTVASSLKIKSWQLIEYVEHLREELGIIESDYIFYESISEKSPVIPSMAGSNVDDIEVQHPYKSASDIDSKSRSNSKQPFIELAAESSGESANRVNLLLVGIVSALLVILVALIGVIANRPTAELSEASQNSSSDNANNGTRPLPSSQPQQQVPSDNSSVSFQGIDLPITNKICNKKNTFCIFGLATIINNETGEASYSFSDMANGEKVNINGVIRVSNIERTGGTRNFTFSFHDDQSKTTPGWAAAGYFNLDQDRDSSKPGILTRFKTTESFGPKTPVGLENTSYLFPQ